MYGRYSARFSVQKTQRLLIPWLVALLSGCLAPMQTKNRNVTAPPPAAAPAVIDVASADAERTTSPDASALDFTMDLAHILRAAIEHNPMVEAARRRWLAAMSKRPQMISLPDPKLEYEYFTRQMGREEAKWGVGLSQEIPYWGTLSLAGKMADKEAEAAHWQYQIAMRDVIAEAKEVYCELYYIDRALDVTAEIETLYTHYATLAAGGGDELAKPKLPERFRAESQLAQLGYDRVLLREMRVAEAAQLRATAGMDAAWLAQRTAPLAEPSDVIPALAELEQQAARYNQELLAAGVDAKRAEIQTKLARRAVIPNLMLSASYMETGDNRPRPDTTRNPISVGVGVSIPLWWGKYGAAIREANELEQAAAAELQGRQVRLDADLARAYFRLNNSARLVRLYRDTLIPQARQAMRSAEELYRGGQANLAALLETTATVHNFELARLRATADFYQNVARMERVVGTALMPPGESLESNEQKPFQEQQ